MNKSQLKQQLIQQQSLLAKRIDKISQDFQKGRSADFAEQATENENNEVLIGLKLEAENELKQIAGALLKIDSDEYGLCEQCGNPIAEERLVALPYANACIHCAS